MGELQQAIKACCNKAKAQINAPIGSMCELLDLKHVFQYTEGRFNQKAAVPILTGTNFDRHAIILFFGQLQQSKPTNQWL